MAMEPQFPLRITPTCLACGHACSRWIVKARNPNNHVGRPYYTCLNPEHEPKFSTWDDGHGIAYGNNPRCWCGSTSRRVTLLDPVRAEFYSCPAGTCAYTANVHRVVGLARPRRPVPPPPPPPPPPLYHAAPRPHVAAVGYYHLAPLVHVNFVPGAAPHWGWA